MRKLLIAMLLFPGLVVADEQEDRQQFEREIVYEQEETNRLLREEIENREKADERAYWRDADREANRALERMEERREERRERGYLIP